LSQTLLTTDSDGQASFTYTANTGGNDTLTATALGLQATLLMVGAAMRHQHAGLAVPDFPLAHGQFYPATDRESVQAYNVQRTDFREFNAITPFQIHLHMTHRFTGLLLAVVVPWVAWRFRREARRQGLPGSRVAGLWMTLIPVQAGLGILTVLMNKPADIATAHVVVGALCLATGAIMVLVANEFSIATAKPVMQSPARPLAPPAPQAQT
jgi:cytochrome c oxidase assembly protein subunit 15